ncbi:MAG: hypothetical protein K0R24_1521 [Gammaproteobacteria bacterium]|jgi:hypothetical protein|nr:hypothetical protein [Gammaproteobacteria bacterium]
MANGILASSTSLGNPVSEIASLIDAALQKRCHLPTDNDLGATYAQLLSTTVGLGFTAILAEGSRIQSCKPHLATFLRYRDLTQSANKASLLAMAIAKITCSAIQPFRVLGFPVYYDDFVSAFLHTLYPHFDASSDIRKEIKKTVRRLFEKCT